ncbi:MAG: type IV pilus assembly protein PilQ [Halanaerobium sp. 4-GBenrich]|jgi:type II secretory pathway component HofQ|uniref:Type IV pilus assembly protein PilQ n=1 Tax=Halanaerobium congolense TaxID=54121 RepID=A0A1M7H387_9FIRM|nr:type II and III secretion system protein [Halanaerobium congolense]KXS50480.1 MAG: type IV pilus assembly protein PilQ [Halanaerobium sp. T82-1]ODS50364.1 MAG: type IV pilus assembly protein PilQ [Halanaerobium sp. 4-GBenrich]OEG62034.1 MAG: type II and III secretion system protein [Halanaerobium sp. MDAL1]TDP27093.1 type IV pilus assembly protein PilQ [Halanaerobium congolense]TDS31705.1 type IV pilus assembly protein PilQ [Halanaerobium congolense]
MKTKNKQLLQILVLVILLLLLSAFIKIENGSAAEIISINLRNVELETALIMLANTADKNLICDSSVAGKLTVIFNDIPFENALDLITDSFDLDYSYQNEIIYISTAEKLAARNKEVISRNFKLKNLSSEAAADILIANFEKIKIINLNSEGLIVSCEKNNISEIENIIKKIDQPQKQIMIKARVEEISRTKIKELGINPNQLSELKIIKNEAGDIDKLKASWPETLRALNEEGLSNILANPSLMTVDRKKAKLIIGDQIPVKLERIEDEQTVSTISYIEAGIVLEFLPKILNNNEVLLEIKPSVNSIGQILADGLPAVNSRSAETTVVLENGETLAIGGLIKKDELRSVREVPILADIPLLGRLFSAEEKNDIETELIIFITPEIITEKPEKEFIGGAAAENETKVEDAVEIESINTADKKQEIKGEKTNIDNRGFKTLTAQEIEEILNK